jgi:hypothetical protein
MISQNEVSEYKITKSKRIETLHIGYYKIQNTSKHNINEIALMETREKIRIAQ